LIGAGGPDALTGGTGFDRFDGGDGDDRFSTFTPVSADDPLLELDAEPEPVECGAGPRRRRPDRGRPGEPACERVGEERVGAVPRQVDAQRVALWIPCPARHRRAGRCRGQIRAATSRDGFPTVVRFSVARRGGRVLVRQYSLPRSYAFLSVRYATTPVALRWAVGPLP
jgi:hypothetical protein